MLNYKCKKKNEAAYVCTTKDCHQHSFVCMSAQCCLEFQHKNCILMSIKQFQQLQDSHQSNVDLYLEKFTKFYENIILKATVQIKQLNELSQNNHKRQKDLAFYKQNSQLNLSGDYVAKIIQTWDVFSSEYWNQIQKQFTQIQNNIEKQLSNIKKTYIRARKKVEQKRNSVTQAKFEINSLIIWKQQQVKALHKIITSQQPKIKQLVCIYRASSNAFSAQQFHRSCDAYQNTIIITKNSKGRVIGGFTNLSWEVDQFESYKKDQEKRSFIFSLNQQQIYPLFQKQYAIQCNKSCGPIFGRGATLWVYDKANTNSAYWHVLPTTYHPQSGEWNDQTYQQFIGAKMYEKFTLVQWQVFQVIYE